MHEPAVSSGGRVRQCTRGLSKQMAGHNPGIALANSADVTSALVLCTPAPEAPALAADLAAAGVAVQLALVGDSLAAQVARAAPDLLVCWDPQPAQAPAGLLDALAQVQAVCPLPVLLFTSDASAEAMERALAAGVQVWVVNGYGANRLRPLLQLALARFKREHVQAESLADVSRRFEERKLVDRAKGILMRARQLSEEDAFRLLRTGAMQSNARIGLVSQQVIDAAEAAEAVNRAGQLRMLSQRVVKLQALRLWGAGAAEAKALLAESTQRIEGNLEFLLRAVSKPTFGDLQTAAVAAWQALAPLLRDVPPDATALAQADRLADTMLVQADRLASALESAGSARSLFIINLAGRQRMLSQRLAKLALLGALPDKPVAAAAAAAALETTTQFEQALVQLGELPLSSAAIRQGLADAQAQWAALRAGANSAHTPAGRQAIAQASEALLDGFDQLTEQYERSMQMLMG
jgi:AmiR/NasT family two-component response regulator